VWKYAKVRFSAITAGDRSCPKAKNRKKNRYRARIWNRKNRNRLWKTKPMMSKSPKPRKSANGVRESEKARFAGRVKWKRPHLSAAVKEKGFANRSTFDGSETPNFRRRSSLQRRCW